MHIVNTPGHRAGPADAISIVASCAANLASTTPTKSTFTSTLALKLAAFKAWFASSRTFYSQRELQRFQEDQAVRRAQYRMRSFY